MATPPVSSKDIIRHPHDVLFKHVFGDPARFHRLLRLLIPNHPLAQVEWLDARLVSGALAGPELRELFTDLLYAFRIMGHPALIYCLTEHKSAAEWRTLLQLLSLMAGLWQRESANLEANKLPLIIPVLVCHGPRPWNQPRRFQDLVDMPDPMMDMARKCVPQFEPVVVDLALTPYESLNGWDLEVLAAKAFKAASESRETEFLDELLVGLKSGIDLKESLKVLLVYMLSAGQRGLRDQIIGVAKATSDATLASEIMTGAEEIRQEGRREGRQEGRIIGQIQTLQDLLGLPEDRVEDLAHQSMDALQTKVNELRRRLGQAQSLRRPS